MFYKQYKDLKEISEWLQNEDHYKNELGSIYKVNDKWVLYEYPEFGGDEMYVGTYDEIEDLHDAIDNLT